MSFSSLSSLRCADFHRSQYAHLIFAVMIVHIQILAEVSAKLGPAMVGISDIKADPVNFRDR